MSFCDNYAYFFLVKLPNIYDCYSGIVDIKSTRIYIHIALDSYLADAFIVPRTWMKCKKTRDIGTDIWYVPSMS